jgi:hypothetical protein
MTEPRPFEDRATDDQLTSIANGTRIPNTHDGEKLVESMAVELIQTRRRNRADNRRAEQIKKLRWAAENTLSKIESLAAADIELTAAQDRADTADSIAARAESKARGVALELRKMRAWIGQLATWTEPGHAMIDSGSLHDLAGNVMKELEIVVTRLEAP